MDVDFLKQVEEFSNLKTALDTKKRNAFEKAKNMLVFAYEGGLFTAASNPILFAKTHDAKRDLIMLDNNSFHSLLLKPLFFDKTISNSFSNGK